MNTPIILVLQTLKEYPRKLDLQLFPNDIWDLNEQHDNSLSVERRKNSYETNISIEKATKANPVKAEFLIDPGRKFNLCFVFGLFEEKNLEKVR